IRPCGDRRGPGPQREPGLPPSRGVPAPGNRTRRQQRAAAGRRPNPGAGGGAGGGWLMMLPEERSAAQDTIRRALEEDLRYGPDVTTLATVPAGAVATASMVPREPGVIAGVEVALLVLDAVLAGGYEVVHSV